MANAWKSDSADEPAAAGPPAVRVSGAVRLARAARLAALALALLACVAHAPAAQASAFSEMKGHASIGFAKVFVDQAPGGSLSFAGGLDVPFAPSWRGGAEFGFSLLGTRNEIRGSLSATIDYSTFEALAYAHWIAHGLGPVERLSLGAGLMSARAEISSAGGGAAFLDLSREELVPAIALQTTLMPHSDAPVRAGLELGTRFGFLESETWTVFSARLAVHY